MASRYRVETVICILDDYPRYFVDQLPVQTTSPVLSQPFVFEQRYGLPWLEKYLHIPSAVIPARCAGSVPWERHSMEKPSRNVGILCEETTVTGTSSF